MTFYEVGIRPIGIGTIIFSIAAIFICRSPSFQEQSSTVAALLGMASASIGIILGYIINYFVWLR